MYLVTDLLAGVSLGELVRSDGRLPIEKAESVRARTERGDGGRARATAGSSRGCTRKSFGSSARQEERLAISSAGIGGMQDLLATMNEATLRGQVAPDELSYVAPELLMGNAADQRADVFTIGALMYYMATGSAALSGRVVPAAARADAEHQAAGRGRRAARPRRRCGGDDHALHRVGRHAPLRNRGGSDAGVADGRPDGCAVVISHKSPVDSPHECLACICAFLPSCITQFLPRVRHFQRTFTVQQHPVAVLLERFLPEFLQQRRRLFDFAGLELLARCVCAASNSSLIRPNCFACSDRAICWL